MALGFLGAIGRGFVGGVKGFVTGGPTGAIVGAGRAVLGGSGRASPAKPRPQIAPRFPGVALVATGKQGPNLPPGFPGAVPEPGFKGGLQRLLPGGQSGFTGAPPGFHINKAYLRFLRGQAMGKVLENPFNEPRAVNVVVRNRKMNPLNPRALKNATRRIRSMKRVMTGALSGTGFKITRTGLGGRKSRKR